jgi:hypothetical protein
MDTEAVTEKTLPEFMGVPGEVIERAGHLMGERNILKYFLGQKELNDEQKAEHAERLALVEKELEQLCQVYPGLEGIVFKFIRFTGGPELPES